MSLIINSDNPDSPADPVERYFNAWKAHDKVALVGIFHTDALYEIDGKAPMKGVREIEAYWDRNKFRQRDLQVLPHKFIEVTDALKRCVFCSTFVDVQEAQRQTVYGLIDFELEDGKIRRLAETYHVARERIAPLIVWDRAGRWLTRAWWWSKANLLAAYEWMLTRGGTVLTVLVALLLGYSAFHISDLPEWLICALNLSLNKCISIAPGMRDELLRGASRALSAATTAWLFIVLILGFLRYRVRHPISIIPLQAATHDLEVMSKRFRKAREVTVFAGDFDFVASYPAIREIFSDLHYRGCLTLISDKTAAAVEAGFGRDPLAKALFESLKQNRRIHFGDPGALRYSIVKQWDRWEVLYRYQGGGADSVHDAHICILRGRREAQPVIDLIRRLSSRAAMA